MSLAVTHEIKRLETRVKELELERKYLIGEVEVVQSKLTQNKKALHGVQTKLEQVRKSQEDLVVSEHAIIRYIERVMGLSLEDIKSKVVPQEVKDILKTMGDCRYTHEGVTYVVKDNTLVTIQTKD